MSLLDDLEAFLTVPPGYRLYKSIIPDTPDKCIGLFFSPASNEPLQGSTGSAGISLELQFQVRVRGERMESEDVETAITDLFNQLNQGEVPGYVYCYATNANMIPMGYDELDRPEYSWNFKIRQEGS